MDWATTDLLDIRTTTKPDLEAMTAEELEELIQYVNANSPHIRLMVAAQSVLQKTRDAELAAETDGRVDSAYDQLPDEYKYTRPVVAER